MSFLFICIAFGQLIVYWFFSLTQGSPVELFTNFCTLANVSMLFLEYNNYGFYIHGQAPWGISDLPLSWLKKELDGESQGKQRSRNFQIRNEVNRQSETEKSITSYEIYVSKQFRQEYDMLYAKTFGGPVPSNPNEPAP